MVAIWAALAFLFRKFLGRLFNLSGSGLYWCLASLVGILAFTIRIWDANGTSDVFWLFDRFAWTQLTRSAANSVLNAALFLPAGLFFVANGKRWWIVLPSLVLLSAALETIQTFTRFGVGDPADFVANSWGAAIGAGIGVGFVHIRGLLRAKR